MFASRHPGDARGGPGLDRITRALRAGVTAARRSYDGDGGPPQADAVDYERIERMVRTVAEEIWQRRSELGLVIQDIAVRDSARFVLDNVPLHLAKTAYDLRRDAVLAAPDGLFMEFGVWKGAWLTQMAELRDVPF